MAKTAYETKAVLMGDIFQAFAKFCQEQRTSLHDSKSMEDFVTHSKNEVEQALKSDILLHGKRAENLFEAMMISLGSYKLLKTEDAGRVHPQDKYKNS